MGEKSTPVFFISALCLVAIGGLVLVLTVDDRKKDEADKYACPAGLEPIRGELTGWFCASRPTLKDPRP
jgi:hypothetical protein